MKNILRQLRKERRLTQDELAKALGVSRQTINAIENDKYNPTLELAIRLAKYVDIPVEELFILE
ncbi:MAG: helix-turn-helix transcriptional regulator [Oscillospiraceae bacterium]|nr:helix-turn-helix transcriptional regulator [Oscillospiraceae bacterium]